MHQPRLEGFRIIKRENSSDPLTHGRIIMGLLSEGKPLSWAETKKNAGLVKEVGVKQFLALYHKVKNRKDVLKWGDEVSTCTIGG